MNQSFEWIYFCNRMIHLNRIEEVNPEIEILIVNGFTVFGAFGIAIQAQAILGSWLGTNPNLWEHWGKSSHLPLKLVSNHSIFQKALNLIEGQDDFDIQCNVMGTDFQYKVWNELCQIPFGQTMHYIQLSQLLKIPNGARAVGAACGANQHALLIPCHRVVHKSGESGHYRWGDQLKSDILHREKLIAHPHQMLF
ncbi:MAG: methylated-DNA--[protein]-cysteine S-methyltransferase [Saprospiraceae bacterium]|nr:methylated-DNA--[protein]-cysteine S-methyltransferase [Saprospiraceae bacterium]